MSRLGTYLKNLRGPLSLYEVSKGSGVATADLSRYEQGRYLPSPNNLKKLADYHEIPYETLRFIYYDDIYLDSEELIIIIKWAHQKDIFQKIDKAVHVDILEKLSCLSKKRQQKILKEFDKIVQKELFMK